MSRKIMIAMAAAIACAGAPVSVASAADYFGPGPTAAGEWGSRPAAVHYAHGYFAGPSPWGYGPWEPYGSYYACYPGNYQFDSPWKACGYPYDWGY